MDVLVANGGSEPALPLELKANGNLEAEIPLGPLSSKHISMIANRARTVRGLHQRKPPVW